MIKKILKGGIGICALGILAITAVPSTSEALVFRDLTIGASGADVTELQTFLVSRGFLTIPAGVNMGYFGSLTQSALARYQASVGISPAVGYFGPVTRAHYNSQAGQVANPVPQPTPVCPPGFVCTPVNQSGNNNNGNLSGGEASLKSFDARSGNRGDIEEGDQDAELMEIRFDVADSDVRVDRADIRFQAANGTDEEDPWDVFDSVSLWLDGKKVKEINSSNRSVWSREGNTDPETHRLRFTGINQTIREDERAEFVVKADIASSINGVGSGTEAEWKIFVPNNGIRAIDAERIDQTIGNNDDVVTFTIGEEGQDEELNISSSTKDPDGTTFEVSESRTSDWETIFAFELEAEDGDIEIRRLPLTIEFFDGETYSSVINDLELRIDGNVYDSVNIALPNEATTTATFSIDRDDLVINEGDTVTAELRARFNRSNGNYDQGDRLRASITSANVDAIDAEGSDDLDAAQLNGSAQGEIHSLRSQGLVIQPGNERTPQYRSNVSDTLSDDQGVFSIEFDVRAFESDQYIELSAFQGTETDPNAGASYTIENSVNATVASTTGNAIAVLERVSGGSVVNGNFLRVNEGETVRLLLTVYYDAASPDSYRVQLHSVNFNSAPAEESTQQIVSPEHRYETPLLFIQN